METTKTKRSKKIRLGNQITLNMARMKPQRRARRQATIDHVQQTFPNLYTLDELHRYTDESLRSLTSSQAVADSYERTLDHSDEVAKWSLEGSVVLGDQPVGSITVSDDSDPYHSTYGADALAVLASESISSITLTVAILTRDQMADVVRVLKPAGAITVVPKTVPEIVRG